VLREALERGGSVEIDGLGTLSPQGKHGVRFVAQTKPRVFIAYVQEDLAFAKKLYLALEENGFRPWLDKKRLMPGQSWPRAIETAIQTSDFLCRLLLAPGHFEARQLPQRTPLCAVLRHQGAAG
jgi:hypothetical protein